MEQICGQLDSCLLCTRRACRWFVDKGRCGWSGRGKVATEEWECVGETATDSNAAGLLTTARTVQVTAAQLPNGTAAPVILSAMLEENEDHAALIIAVSCVLGFVLLAAVAYGLYRMTHRRQFTGGMSRVRLLESMREDSEMLVARSPQVPNPPPTTTTSSAAAVAASSTAQPGVHAPRQPISATGSQAQHLAVPLPPQSTPLSAPRPSTPPASSSRGTQLNFFDNSPETAEEIEMEEVELTPPAERRVYNLRSNKSGYNLRSSKKKR